jgi:hypothetical protein
MTWVEALRNDAELWADFVTDLRTRVDTELRKMLSLRGDDLLLAKGAALFAQRMLDEAVAGEREDHARAIRRARESNFYRGRTGNGAAS